MEHIYQKYMEDRPLGFEKQYGDQIWYAMKFAIDEYKKEIADNRQAQLNERPVLQG